MTTHLSFNTNQETNQEAWRVIHNGMPLTGDFNTAKKAIDAVKSVFPNQKIETSRFWDGDNGTFKDF